MTNKETGSNIQFTQDLEALKKQIEELDELIATPQDGPIFDKDLLNLYGVLVRQICSAFGAHTFHVFFQNPDDQQLIDGVMIIRDQRNNIRLQFIRLPVDPLTFAGYTFMHKQVVNVADLYASSAEHPDLKPTRHQLIDERLSQPTKEGLAAPIISAKSQEPIGVVLLCNTNNNAPFPSEYEHGIQELSSMVGESHAEGLFSRILMATKDSGKAGFVTSLLQGQTGEDSSLSEDDIFIKTPVSTSKKVTAKTAKSPPVDERNQNQNPPEPNFSETQLFTEQMVADAQSVPEKSIPEEKQADSPEKTDQTQAETPAKNTVTAEDINAAGHTPAIVRTVKKVNTFKPIREAEETLSERLKRLTITSEPEDGVVYETRYHRLIHKELITESDLQSATEAANKERLPIDEVLEKKFKIPQIEIGKSLSAYYGMPYFQFDEKIDFPLNLLKNMKHEYFESEQWMPIVREDKHPYDILVISTDPFRAEMGASISQMLPRPNYRMLVTTAGEFQLYFNTFFTKDQMSKMLVELEASAVEVKEDIDLMDTSISEDDLVKLVNRVIAEAYARRASDIHIEPYPGTRKTVIRFRIDGELVEFLRLSPSLRTRIINRIKVMAELNISEQRVPQDGKINMARFARGLDIELRVATYPVIGGSVNIEDCVMRILASGEPLPMEKLGINDYANEGLRDAIEKPYGILFVCGPTGSGKTTTLHSLLKLLNTPNRKILTAEDPVEITQYGLRQMQIEKKAGMSFATAMRAFLRADPDVIMVGEMRDFETVSTGVEASLTGHLVLSTLHTNSAPEATVRLLDMGMEPLNFADAMLGILAQRLAKRLCLECRQAYEASDEEIDTLADNFCNEYIRLAKQSEEKIQVMAEKYNFKFEQLLEWKKNPEMQKQIVVDEWLENYGEEDGKITLYKPKGCVSCLEGYQGRVGIYEYLSGIDAVKEAVKHRGTVDDLLSIALEDGMHTLRMDGIHKVLDGKTDYKQIALVCMK